MPAISITDDQRERLHRIQSRLAEDVEYGHVRPRDALEYLLDRFDEADGTVTRTDSTESTDPTESAPATSSTSDSSSEPTPKPARTGEATSESTEFVVMNGGGGIVDRSRSGGADGPELADEADEADVSDGGSTDETDRDDETAASDDDAAESEETGDDESTDGTRSADTNDADGADASDGTRLNAVMSLLADHDGKWRETGGGEEKYEVDLPDGGTERARTKDDVRAVLFKHYR